MLLTALLMFVRESNKQAMDEEEMEEEIIYELISTEEQDAD